MIDEFMFVYIKPEFQDNSQNLLLFLQEYQQFLVFINIPIYLSLLL